MIHAEKCPVCNGSGRTESTETETGTLVRKSQPCHGCNGKGWVEVGVPDVPYYPTPMSYYPYPYDPWMVTYTIDGCGANYNAYL